MMMEIDVNPAIEDFFSPKKLKGVLRETEFLVNTEEYEVTKLNKQI